MITKETFFKLVNKTNNLESNLYDSFLSIDHNKRDVWNYIPFRHANSLWEVLQALKVEFPGRKNLGFLDVGAGSGRIVHIMKKTGLFSKVCGVEFHKPYVNFGRKLYKLNSTELICKDAFTVDREFLKDIHMIYTYMPIRDKNIMGNLHNYLWNCSLADRVMVEMYPVYYPVNVLSYTDKNLLINKKGDFQACMIKKTWQEKIS